MSMKNPVRCGFFVTLTVAIAAAAMPIVLLGQPKTSRTDALTRDAEVIVVGKVGQVVSTWTNNRTKIETRVTVAINQTIKGNAPGNSIEVVIPGGEIDGVGEWYSHSARFERDEDIVLFAKKEKNGRYRVAGGESGKFSIKKDERTGAKIIPNVGTLDEFTSTIKKSAKSTDSGTIRR